MPRQTTEVFIQEQLAIGKHRHKDMDTTAESYDKVNYEGHTYGQTNPATIYGTAKLFGIDAPDPRKARILELGCAVGHNIAAIASIFPESECVGIDYAKSQIERGQKMVEQIGLKNLRLEHISITDITKKFGVFDYIIAHGLLSWMSPEVQDKLIKVCKNNLSPKGIAFVSYNVKPGWAIPQMVREMVSYHVARFDDPATQVAQARLLLKSIVDMQKERGNPMAALLEQELNIINRQPEYYLLHEYLEGSNYQFYFADVVRRFEKVGLSYLAEATLASMSINNLPADIAKALGTINNQIRAEQYMDFFTGMRFRNTLFCHKEVKPNYQVNAQVVTDGLIRNYLWFEKDFSDAAINSGKETSVRSYRGRVGFKYDTTKDPLALAMWCVLKEMDQSYISFDTFLERTYAKLKQSGYPQTATDAKAYKQQLMNYIVYFIFAGGIGYCPKCVSLVDRISYMPEISPYVRYLAQTQDWCCNLFLEVIKFTIQDKLLIPLVDGTRTLVELSNEMARVAEATGVELFEVDGTPVKGAKDSRERMMRIVTNQLKLYMDNHLLVK